ncbi:tetratricopeptide repeat protein [Amycolatopsis sp. SID8362]|uniref:ATP-binding protein n=1 Tax=Amycolatopsis sp. SID8362 TaxID=2690346 RepID=UPI00281535B1|nr:tetratricopeptide repeat protein [Amycolatopsis sp. SID8362]
MRDGLDQIVRTAFAAAGLAWADCYHETSGDAVLALVPADTGKAAFVETVLPALVVNLRIHNDKHPPAQRIRLRVALHAGEVGYDVHGVTSGSLTRAFRLCSAPALKAALASSPGVLGVIASDWLFTEVIRHVPAAAPGTWRSIAVRVKEVDTTGWVTLPDHPYLPDPAAVDGGTSAGRLRGNPPARVPRQLPASVRDFTGRAEHLAALDALVPDDSASGGEPLGRETPSVVITAVDGAGGIGKTTLALHWAHRAQDRFPDGTLHVNLRGYGPGEPTGPSDALNGFLRALGVAPRAIPADADAQAALLRSLLAGKRVLLILDNAHSAEQVRPLLPGTSGCMVVVTSRESLTGLVVTDAAHRLTLDLLSPSEAHELVAGIIGAERAVAESDATRELIRLCGRLPLALRIAASRVAAHPHHAVVDVVAELADDRTRLDILSEAADERSAVRAVFDWSYRRLTTEQARLFRRLGLHPGPDLSAGAAAALAELPVVDVRPLLSALTAAHLIEPARGGRYRFHDLLRAYAADRAHRQDAGRVRDRAVESLLTWYTHTARAADRHVHPHYVQIPAVVGEPAQPHPLAGFDEAWGWLTAERANLHAALEHVADRRLDHFTIPLVHVMRFLLSAGGPQDWLDALPLGVAAAHRSGTPRQEAFLSLSKVGIAYSLNRDGQAGDELGRVAALVEQIGDSYLELCLLNYRGLLAIQQKRFEEAVQYLVAALPLTRGIDTGRFEAVVEGNLSSAFTGLAQYRRALEHGERGLDLRRRVRDVVGESTALTRLARARRGLEDFETAASLCREAIAIGRRSPRERDATIADPLDVLASCLHRLGDVRQAVDCWREAAAIYDETGYLHKAAEVRGRLRQTSKLGEHSDQAPANAVWQMF